MAAPIRLRRLGDLGHLDAPASARCGSMARLSSPDRIVVTEGGCLAGRRVGVLCVPAGDALQRLADGGSRGRIAPITVR